MLIEKINKPNDIKKLNIKELDKLAEEIRELIIDTVSKNGGHLASNLGVVELTMALHYVMEFPKDRLIFDVSHQSYVHKILTGRRKSFDTLRQKGGISGFSNPEESDCDTFFEGHASASIGEGVGLAAAKTIKGKNNKVAVVIGDGALTGGLVLEAINNATVLKDNLTIILNDNQMSISKNVGGINSVLSSLRTSQEYTDLKNDVTKYLERIPVGGDTIVQAIKKSKRFLKQFFIPGMIFEDMDIMYLGPVDGHDVSATIKILNKAFRYKGTCIVHVITQKGMGYIPAMKYPDRFHGISPFDIKTGKTKPKKVPDYSDIFSSEMAKLGAENQKLCAVTAAMSVATGLKRFEKLYPDRFFDVGIAESHAILMATGLSKEGLKPVVSIYSTFLQRSIDQAMMNVCLNRLPVVFAIDRAGIVGADGATHQGLYDISYLSMMPNMTLMAPKNQNELRDMIRFAVEYDGPIAIRYPRGRASTCYKTHRATIEYGKSEVLEKGKDVVLFAYGSMVETGQEIRELLLKEGIDAEVVNARFAKPLDIKYLSGLKQKLVVTMEEHSLVNGFGIMVESALYDNGYKGKVIKIGVPDIFVEHGNPDAIKEMLGMDAVSIVNRIREVL